MSDHDENDERLVSGKGKAEENVNLDAALRPKSLSDIYGQELTGRESQNPDRGGEITGRKRSIIFCFTGHPDWVRPH